METLEIPSFITYAIPAFFLLIGVELSFQWITGRKLYNFRDSIADLSTGVLNRGFTLLYIGFTVAAYSLLFEKLRLVRWDLEDPAQLWMSAILGFLVFDFLYYWAHRMSHEWNVLWAGHVVHHQSEEFNLTVALRQPAFHQLFTWIFFLPLALLGIHPAVLIAIGEISLIYQFWIHTRVIKDLGLLEWILNTPSHHRVHHGRNPEYIDKNHGGTLIIWDRLFGTFAREREEPVYGIVKPFRSYDPLYANLQYWREIVGLMRRASGPLDKLRILFRPPGFEPEHPEKPIVVPSVRPGAQPYRQSTSWARILYVGFWFAVVSGLSLAFLVSESTSVWVLLAVVLWSTLSLVALGQMLSETRRWKQLEAMRLSLTAVLCILLTSSYREWLPEPVGAGLMHVPFFWAVLYAACALGLGWLIGISGRQARQHAEESSAL
ncbi:MAG: sterol desaturase [Spirochaetaceae bacterium]|nr:sterol desaturase [Spirochaetaceae bacterium]|tara:strand:- start:382862 stop:384163 length:1302 start_codon:yes stop_codon:yes gene_type:complete